MNEKIYILDRNHHLREMEAQDYDNEDLLQTILVEHPDLLAGHQMNEAEPRRWMLVAREMGVPDTEGGANRWSLDHLFLDQDGVPTLVEVKRARDTRIRREVVGQMFDYAANALVHWPVDTVRNSFESTCAANGANPNAVVAELLDHSSDSDDEIEDFWQSVEDNLSLGRLRLIFLADSIPVELKRIIEFLNEQMPNVEVLGVELRQFVGADLTALVPRVIGQTTAAEKAKKTGRQGRQWDEPTFFAELAAKCDPDAVTAAQSILEWARKNHLREWWGKGKNNGSFVPVYDHPSGTSHTLFSIWTNCYFEFYFYYHQFRPPFDSEEMRLGLIQRLNGVPGVGLQASDSEKRPSVPLSNFRNEQNLKMLLDTYEWYMAEVDRMGPTEI